MKKIVIILLICVSLVGCNKEEYSPINICTYHDDKVEEKYVFTSNGDIVSNVEHSSTYYPSNFGATTFKDMDEETRKKTKDELLKQYGLESEEDEGYKFNITFEDNMVVTITIDMNVAKEDIIDKTGLQFLREDRSLKNALIGLESLEFECK